MAPEAPERAAATAEKRAVPTLVPEIQTISFTEIPDGRFSSGTDRETPVEVAILASVAPAATTATSAPITQAGPPTPNPESSTTAITQAATPRGAAERRG